MRGVIKDVRENESVSRVGVEDPVGEGLCFIYVTISHE